MTLLVGLGNPGVKYENTRHNIGFMVADELITSEFKNISSSKFQGEVYKKDELLILKPQTFMNLSGNSVLAVKNFFKPDRIIVIHDDLDLNFATLRFKIGGGSGGHNGLKSIDEMVGQNYERVRIGISKPKFDIINYVISDFKKEELDYIKGEFLGICKKALSFMIKNDLAQTSNKFTIRQGKNFEDLC